MSPTATYSPPSPRTLFESLGQEFEARLVPPDDYDHPSLIQFVRAAWHVLEPSNPYVDGWHIDAICDHLEAVTRGEIRNLVINMPPRHAKSLVVSVFWPCWEWIDHPERRWLYASYAQNLSTRDSLKCRRVIQSSWYRSKWGHRFRLTSDQNVKTRFDNDKTGYRIATSVSGFGTGEGGDRIVCDDPHSVREAESKTVRESVLTWWDETMSTRFNDPQTGTRVIVMQRVHEEDLSGHVLSRGEYEHLCLPARFEPQRATVTAIGWTDPRTRDGQLLWPERFDEPAMADLEEHMTPHAAAGQLQQRPAPREGNLFKREWWRRYRTLPALTKVAQFVDSAFKVGVGNDYTVCATWGTDGLGNYYVIDLWRRRLEYPDMLRALHDVHSQHAGRAVTVPIVIEDKASGQSALQSLRRPLPTMDGDRLPALPALPFPDKENDREVEIARLPKFARAEGVTALVQAGCVFLPDDAPWVDGFIQEHADFPGGAHDDQVDTTSMALTRLQIGSGKTRMRAL